jgi:DNA-directed RNA polymerase I, II, and III subunit RPABC1
MYRVRKTVLQMLVDRGYLVAKEELEQTLELFKQRHGLDEKIRDNLTISVPKRDDPTALMMVFFGPVEKLNVDHLRNYCSIMETGNAKKSIIISESNPTPRFNELVSQLNSEGLFHFQIFSDKELLVNITEHILVPQHVPLTSEQTKELLKRYKLKLSQLPRIQTVDPIARYYGLSKGQVVKIIRQSETAGRYVTYRTVV